MPHEVVVHYVIPDPRFVRDQLLPRNILPPHDERLDESGVDDIRSAHPLPYQPRPGQVVEVCFEAGRRSPPHGRFDLGLPGVHPLELREPPIPGPWSDHTQFLHHPPRLVPRHADRRAPPRPVLGCGRVPREAGEGNAVHAHGTVVVAAGGGGGRGGGGGGGGGTATATTIVVLVVPFGMADEDGMPPVEAAAPVPLDGQDRQAPHPRAPFLRVVREDGVVVYVRFQLRTQRHHLEEGAHASLGYDFHVARPAQDAPVLEQEWHVGVVPGTQRQGGIAHDLLERR